MATAPTPRSDARRRHEEVRATVREATLHLVKDQAYKDRSVDEIARAAGLSRSAFYFYFRDKQDLLMAVAEDLTAELMSEAARWWSGEGPAEELVREALEGVVAVYERHAALFRVASEVASYDEEVWALWRELAQRFVTRTADHMRSEMDAGRMRKLDPDATAESLVWMMERQCYVYLARGEGTSEKLVDALTAVWVAALYPEPGRRPPAKPPARSGGR